MPLEHVITLEGRVNKKAVRPYSKPSKYEQHPDKYYNSTDNYYADLCPKLPPRAQTPTRADLYLEPLPPVLLERPRSWSAVPWLNLSGPRGLPVVRCVPKIEEISVFSSDFECGY